MENEPYDSHPQRFHYHSLSGRQFRILALQANAKDKPINIRVWIKDLDDLQYDGGVPYNAVSYRWTTDTESEVVLIDGLETKISASIYHFLLNFRSKFLKYDLDNWTPFWIDQICINQADRNDKAQQLPLMRAIYEQSHTVFIYLPPRNDSDLAIDLIVSLYEMKQQSEKAGEDFCETFLQSGIYNSGDSDVMRRWKALSDFMQRDYWGRTWILQEACAKNLQSETIICGDRELVFAGLLDVAGSLRRLAAQDLPYSFILKEVWTAPVMRINNFALYREPQAKDSVDLFRLLHFSRRTYCADARDKVYCMLSFAPDTEDYNSDPYLKIDYSNDVTKTYGNIVKWHIKKYRNCESPLLSDPTGSSWLIIHSGLS